MGQDNLHININNELGSEVVLRQGEALPLREPVAFKVPGELGNVLTYIMRHKEAGEDLNYVDPKKAMIVINREAMSIKLDTEPTSAYNNTVIGKLEISPELEQFKINTNHLYKREDLVKLLRFNSRFFEDKEKYTTLLDAYKEFKADISANMQASGDERGNRSAGFTKQVTSNIPQEFILSMPIYKGQNKKRFVVSICYDTSESLIRFWLESVELAELMGSERDKLLSEQVTEIEDEYVVLYQ